MAFDPDAYLAAKQPTAAPAAPGSELPDISDVMKARAASSDPNSLENTASRVVSGAIGGIPDLGISAYNAGARLTGNAGSQLPYVTPMMRENAGTPELAANASPVRRLLEGAATMLVGGGAGGAARAAAAAPSRVEAIAPTLRSLATTVAAPTVTSAVGGAAGGAIGNKLGDRDTGELIGSLLGGVAPGAAGNVVYNRFANRAGPNAPAIAAAAERQGVTPTAGMLGNAPTQMLEKLYSGARGSTDVTQGARNTALDQIRGAIDRSAEARGSTTAAPTPGTIGAQIGDVARGTAEDLQARSDAGQQRLTDRMGPATPLPIESTQRAGYSMMTDPAARLNEPAAQAIDTRLQQLQRFVNRDPSGQPILDPSGSQTVPVGNFAGWRTDLGRTIDQGPGGRQPPVTALYPPATEALRGVAEQQGVSPQNFNTVQQMTRDIMREKPAEPGGPLGDYQEMMRIGSKDAPGAYSHMFSDRNLQNPDRVGMLEATQHPGVPGIMGDFIRQTARDTIGDPRSGARGPSDYASAIETMHPEVRSTIAGPELPNIQDTATLARAYDYPPNQAGLTRSLATLVNHGAAKAATAGLGALLGAKLGPLLGVSPATGGAAGGAVGAGAHALFNNLGARAMQSEYARNAMVQGPRAPVGINDLVAAMTAAAQQRR